MPKVYAERIGDVAPSGIAPVTAATMRTREPGQSYLGAHDDAPARPSGSAGQWARVSR
jgi:hypothetical protein